MSSGVPAISVIVATFDRPSALARCLESLLIQQTTRPVEIIVVDNHPQSGLTAAVAGRFPGVRWLEEPVEGLSTARNCGIQAAAGTVIVTTDDDVIAHADWLESLTAPLFEQDGGLAATTGRCLAWKVETQAEVLIEAYGGFQRGDRPEEFDRNWMNRWRICFPQLWRIGSTANAAFLRSVLSNPAVGLFETRLGSGTPAGAWEDLYCFYRILRAGYRIRYVPEAHVLHAHREGLPELARQLCAYRRGETAFLALILIRHGDARALGQIFLWIPYWRLSLLAKELRLRSKGQARFPFSLMFAETLAYFAGPWSLWRGHRRVR